MAKPSVINPLGYIIQRQYNESLTIKNKLYNERLTNAKNLFRKDLYAHYGCVNAIEFSEEGELLVSGGDDRRVLLWSMSEAMYNRGKPVSMRTTHSSNIFCVAFDSHNERIFSGGNDDQVLVHETYSGNLITNISHKKPVYGLSINPQSNNVIATAGEDGRLLVFDIRESSTQDVQVLAKQKAGFHSVMFNPTNPRLVVSANSEEGIVLWDCRKPKEELIHYDLQSGRISGISACFNSTGDMVLALRRRLPPVIYSTQLETTKCQFYHPQYYNSCTMKTCCFAGSNDEYVLSGSDDFNLYMWKVPKDDSEWGASHVVLKGHRSIVNQVRYNRHNNMIASSGVEKMIKLWTSIPIGTWKGSLLKEHADPARVVYSHEEYISLVGHSGERISHDYSDQSVLEDAKMMAFFDSLIQREIEGWDSDSDSMFSSDSDSDDSQQAYSKLITVMFRNGKASNDELKKHNKYNRITQLISKKKTHLAKMAQYKSPTFVQRQQQKESLKKQKNLLKQKALKSNGLLKNKSGKLRHEENSHGLKVTPEKNRYFTRHSAREELNGNIEPNGIIDTPSTSTGITNSNSSVYRVIQDSDDDDNPPAQNETENAVTEDNLVNILPTPLNGTHDMYLKILNVNNDNSHTRPDANSRLERPSVSSSNSTEHRLRKHKNNIKVHEDGCASTSSSVAYINKYLDTYNSSLVNATESDSDYEFDCHTPVKKRRTHSASDSGCGTAPCSSSSTYSYSNLPNRQECSTNGTYSGQSSDEEYKYETFKKRVKKVRLNIRRHIGADSDSN